MPMWPDLDASLDYDAGWRQRFFEADRLGRCRPVARPVFHHVAEAVFGIDGALARLTSGRAVAIYLQAGGIGVVLGRADQAAAADPLAPLDPARRAGAGTGSGAGGMGKEGGDGDDGDAGVVVAVVLAPDRPRPVTAADLTAALAPVPGGSSGPTRKPGRPPPPAAEQAARRPDPPPPPATERAARPQA